MKKNKSLLKNTISKKESSKKRKEEFPLFQPMSFSLVVILILLSWSITYFIFYLVLSETNHTAIMQTELNLADKTANWQTYINNKYGFEIKHPSNLTYSVIDVAENVGPKEVQQKINFRLDAKSSVIINVWKQEAIGADDSWKKEKYAALTVDNKAALQNIKKQEGGLYFVKTYVYSELYVYDIEYYGVEEQENINLYNTMISSFRTTK